MTSIARRAGRQLIHGVHVSSVVCVRPAAAFARYHSASACTSSLPPPSVVFSNHHLLVVNKPAGWHSIPRNHASSKCLLSHLKKRRLGGGSAGDFLRPVHRLDQPCTGILVLAKNSKAASRIQKSWAMGEVQKEYLCVIEAPSMEAVRNRSMALQEFQQLTAKGEQKLKSLEWGSSGWTEKDEIYVLSGILEKRAGVGKGSVMVTPIDRIWMEQQQSNQSPGDNDIFGSGNKLCLVKYRHLASLPDRRDGKRSNEQVHLIAVRTNTGARHQVRALLSAVGGCPLVGDLRYGSVKPALPDRSVALHARALYLPEVKLGGTDLARPFSAPIPSPWKAFFGLREDEIAYLEE